MADGIERTAGGFWDARAREYDAFARLGMPRYDEMLDQLVRSLPEAVETVLELGCGTGALTERLLARFPGVRLRALDAAPEMLAVARERLEARHPGASVELCPAEFEALEAGPLRFDLLTSSMALHHVRDKAPVYAVLRRTLAPGGYFVFADELTAVASHVETLHWNGWLDFARQPGHLDEAQIAETIEHVEQLDHYETLPDQLALLSGAGFAEVDCVWRYLNYAIFTARAA
jgi:tRNA (cmo5U34)-methyltransferase